MCSVQVHITNMWLLFRVTGMLLYYIPEVHPGQSPVMWEVKTLLDPLLCVLVLYQPIATCP